MPGKSQFVGAAGQYHVAYCLAVRGIHAAITMGNAPSVDIIASKADGSRTISLQVKTSSWAQKTSFKHRCREFRASLVNAASNRLWFAFVDLQETAEAGAPKWSPKVCLVPSLWVAGFVDTWGPGFYQLRDVLWPECEERWDRLASFLDGDADVERWCSTVPKEAIEWPGIEPKPRHNASAKR